MVIPQAERFATKFVIHKLSIKLFNKMLAAMNAKSNKAQGNSYVFLTNSLLYAEVQEILGAYLKDYKTDGAFIWSKGENKMVKVGAAYDSYSFMNNTITFVLERALDLEYPSRKYGIMLDLTADKAAGKSALDFVTFKGGQFIHNKIAGVGGMTGLASGEVSSPVAGLKHVMWGYAGACLYNPYKSVIVISDEVNGTWV